MSWSIKDFDVTIGNTTFGVQHFINNTSSFFAAARNSITRNDATHDKFGDSPKTQLQERIKQIASAAITCFLCVALTYMLIHQGYSILTNAPHPLVSIVSFAGAGIPGLGGIVSIKEIALQSIAIHREKNNP